MAKIIVIKANLWATLKIIKS